MTYKRFFALLKVDSLPYRFKEPHPLCDHIYTIPLFIVKFKAIYRSIQNLFSFPQRTTQVLRQSVLSSF